MSSAVWGQPFSFLSVRARAKRKEEYSTPCAGWQKKGFRNSTTMVNRLRPCTTGGRCLNTRIPGTPPPLCPPARNKALGLPAPGVFCFAVETKRKPKIYKSYPKAESH